MSEKALREALERLTAETDNPISREIGRAALAASEPDEPHEYVSGNTLEEARKLPPVPPAKGKDIDQ